jgi:hypothetical protein
LLYRVGLAHWSWFRGSTVRGGVPLTGATCPVTLSVEYPYGHS